MKKYAKLGVVLLIVISLVVLTMNIHNATSFFENSNIIYGNKDSLNKNVEILKEKTGFTFEENVPLHKALLINCDNMTFYEMSDTIERRSEQKEPIACYTKKYETEEMTINFILIDGLSEVTGAYTIGFQIEWRDVTSKFLPRLSVENMLWNIENQKNNYLLCYYEASKCWLEKEMIPASIINVDYYPQKLTFFEAGNNAENTKIQIWGSIMPTEEYSNNRKLIRLHLNLYSRISKKEKFEYIIEWWDTDSNLQ